MVIADNGGRGITAIAIAVWICCGVQSVYAARSATNVSMARLCVPSE